MADNFDGQGTIAPDLTLSAVQPSSASESAEYRKYKLKYILSICSPNLSN